MRQGNDLGHMVFSGHCSNTGLNNPAPHWRECHRTVFELYNENRLAGQVITPESSEVAVMRARHLAEGNEGPRPRIDLEDVRKRLAMAL